MVAWSDESHFLLNHIDGQVHYLVCIDADGLVLDTIHTFKDLMKSMSQQVRAVLSTKGAPTEY